VVRASLTAWLSLALGVIYVPTASAQVAPAGEQNSAAARQQMSPSRVRNAFRKAQDYYRKGEYELAARFFQEAQAGHEELTATEQKELANLSQLNASALMARREGAARLHEAEELARKGKSQEAAGILKAVAQNQQFLAGTDKQKLQTLMERVAPGASEAIDAPSRGNGGDLAQARSMLRQARGMIARGNYDAALALAREAEQKNVTYAPQEDTPKKVLDDIARRSSPGVPDDPKSLLAAARQSLARRELDAREQFARGAHKKKGKVE